MPTPKRPTEDGATPKPTRRRSTSPSTSANTTQPTETQATHDSSRNVTAAKPPASASVPTPDFGATLPVRETPRNADDEIRRRAYELYEQDGQQHGRDREHWLRAEAEVLGRASEKHSSEDQARDAMSPDRDRPAPRRTQKTA
jgi:hypothetical protein